MNRSSDQNSKISHLPVTFHFSHQVHQIHEKVPNPQTERSTEDDCIFTKSRVNFTEQKKSIIIQQQVKSHEWKAEKDEKFPVTSFCKISENVSEFGENKPSMMHMRDNILVGNDGFEEKTERQLEEDKANSTMDSILSKSQFFHLDEQEISFSKQKTIYLNNIKRLQQQKSVNEEENKRLRTLCEEYLKEIQQKGEKIEKLQRIIAKGAQDKMNLLRNIKKLNDEMWQQEKNHNLSILEFQGQVKQKACYVERLEKQVQNSKIENEWRKSNQKRKDTILTELTKQKNQLKIKIHEQNLQLKQAKQSFSDMENKLDLENKKTKNLEEKKEDLLRQIINNKKLQQRLMKSWKEEAIMLSSKLAKKSQQFKVVLSFLGVEPNQEMGMKAIKQKLRRSCADCCPHLQTIQELNRIIEGLERVNEEDAEELIKMKMKSLNSRYRV